MYAVRHLRSADAYFIKNDAQPLHRSSQQYPLYCNANTIVQLQYTLEWIGPLLQLISRDVHSCQVRFHVICLAVSTLNSHFVHPVIVFFYQMLTYVCTIPANSGDQYLHLRILCTHIVCPMHFCYNGVLVMVKNIKLLINDLYTA